MAHQHRIRLVSVQLAVGFVGQRKTIERLTTAELQRHIKLRMLLLDDPNRAKPWEDARGAWLTVAKAPQDALDDARRPNDLETNRNQGNEAGNHDHRLLKVRVRTLQAEGAGQDQDQR